eukprot:jgi/Ulvmu1/11542/UM078_0032.1
MLALGIVSALALVCGSAILLYGPWASWSILQILSPLLGFKVTYTSGNSADHATYSISVKRGRLSNITVHGLSVTRPWRLLLHWRLEVTMQSVEVSLRPIATQAHETECLPQQRSAVSSGTLILLMLTWKCIAPLLGFTLPSTSFKVTTIRVLTSNGGYVASSGVVMFHIVSRGVCRIVATTAVWDGKLYSSTPKTANSCNRAGTADRARQNGIIAALDSFVCKADTGSRSRLIDHLDISLGALSYSASAQDLIMLIGSGIRPYDPHKQRSNVANAGDDTTPLQSRLVQAITNVQRYRNQLPIRAELTFNRITVMVPAPPSASDVAPCHSSSAPVGCLLHFQLKPSEVIGDPNPVEYGHEGKGRHAAQTRPSQAGKHMTTTRPAALRVVLSRPAEQSQKASTTDADTSCPPGRRSVGQAESASADNEADRHSCHSNAESTMIRQKDRAGPTIVLQASTGAACCRFLGDGVSVRCAGTRSEVSVQEMPGAIACGRGSAMAVSTDISLQMKLLELQTLCLLSRLADFDHTHRLVDRINEACPVHATMMPAKKQEDQHQDDLSAEAAARQRVSWSLDHEALAAGGLPNIDWHAKLAVEHGCCIRLLDAGGFDGGMSMTCSEEGLSVPQASFQLGSMSVEASGGVECAQSAARISAGHDWHLPAHNCSPFCGPFSFSKPTHSAPKLSHHHESHTPAKQEDFGESTAQTCAVMLSVSLDKGYLAFTASFADEAALLLEGPRDLFQTTGADSSDPMVQTLREGQGFAAMPSLFRKGGVLQHALSWNHAAVTLFAAPTQVSSRVWDFDMDIDTDGIALNCSPHQICACFKAYSRAMSAAHALGHRLSLLDTTQDAENSGQIKVDQAYVRTPDVDQTLRQPISWHRVSCTASVTSSQASWCQAVKPAVQLPPAHCQQQTGTTGRGDVMLCERSTAKRLLLYNHWELQSTNFHGSFTKAHADLVGQVRAAAWHVDWLELPQPCTDPPHNVVPEVSPDPAVSKVLQWHGNLTNEQNKATAQDQHGHTNGKHFVNRWKMTDPSNMPLSCSVAYGHDSMADAEVSGLFDGFHTASSIDHISAVELHRIMAGCCSQSLLFIKQIDCMARGLSLSAAGIPDEHQQDTEAISLSCKGFQAALDIDAAIVQLAAAHSSAIFIQALLDSSRMTTVPASTAEGVPHAQRPPAPESLPASPRRADPGHSGFLSIQAHPDLSVQPASPHSSLKRLMSASSLCTAESAAPTPAHLKPAMLSRWLQVATVSVQGAQCTVCMGPEDYLGVCFDGSFRDAGRSASVHSLVLELNRCTMVEARDIDVYTSVTTNKVSGMDDLTADVSQVEVTVTGQTAVLLLPHSQDIGRFYAFARLWLKAAMQLLEVQARTTSKSLNSLAADINCYTNGETSMSLSPIAATGPASALPPRTLAATAQPRILLVVSLAQVAVRMESHPLERRLAIIRPVLMHTAAAMASLDSAMGEYERMAKTSAARAAAKKPSIAASMLAHELQDSSEILERLSGHVVLQHRTQTMEALHAANASGVDQPGHVVNLVVRGVSGNIRVDGQDAVSFAESASSIYGLDRASHGLALERCQRIQLDVRTEGCTMRLGTMSDPFATCNGCQLTGPIIMARLQSLPPQMEQIVIPLGSWHSSVVSVPQIGCRPPLKAYTDISATISGTRVAITAAQTPGFAALSQSIQRLVPASRVRGDGSRVPPDPSGPPSLAWWDRARYMWRGRLRSTLLDLSLCVAPVNRPGVLSGDPCMDVACKQLDISLNPDAQTAVSAVSLNVSLRLPHHEQRSRPDAAPLRVPLCALASAAITVALGLELPHGRAAGAHHVHPLVAVGQRVRLEGTQGPVDLSAVLAATAISVSVAVSIQSMALCGLGDGQSAPIAQAGVLYYSEEAVSFMQDLSAAFARAPRHIRTAPRRSFDFWHRRRSLAPPPRAQLPEVISSISLTVHSTDCGVQHHVVAAGDLGEVHVRPKDASMEARWERSVDSMEATASRDTEEFSQAASLPPPLAYSYAACAPQRKVLASLSVSASSLQLLRLITTSAQPAECPTSARGAEPLAAAADSVALQELQGQADGSELPESVGTADGVGRVPVHGWEDMGTIKRVSVFQAPVPPSSSDDRRRPIMVIADSIRLIVTDTTRLALASAILHAKAPFGPRPDAQDAGAHASQIGDTGSLHDFASRTVSGGPDQLGDSRSSSAFQRGQLDLQVGCSIHCISLRLNKV